MVKVVVFDLGNVVWHHEELFKEFQKEWSRILGISYDEFRTRYQGVYVDFEKGKKEVWDWFRELKPDTDSRIFEEVLEKTLNNKEKFEIYYNRGVVNLIAKLRGDYKVGLLSNSENYIYPYVHKKMEGWFDFSIISWQTGCRKPDEEIYKLIFKQGNFKPEEIVFIDDKEENVETAKKLGIIGIKFDNNKQLFCVLNKLK